MKRREFLKTGAGVAGAALASRTLGAQEKGRKDMIWANLLHLSYNMWCDWDSPQGRETYTNRTPDLRFDEPMWNEILSAMTGAGMNMVIIDLGNGVQYESHPEIAVKNAWSREKLRGELAKLRKMDLEPIPKMNFSATHDTWLGPYSHCLSSEKYYAVCKDLIAEAIALFDKPRFFHLGMDEETPEHQRNYEYAVIRQHDLWWRDFYFFVEQVEKSGSRAWIWSDYLWGHRDLFLKKMPKTVVQSNWYYGTKFEKSERAVEAYTDLADNGYEQIPTASNWSSPDSFGLTVDYCVKNIPHEKLLGFMQTPWKPTLTQCRQRHLEAIEQVKQARAKLA